MDTALVTTATPLRRAGAPTSYRPEYCQMVMEHFEQKTRMRRVRVSSEHSEKDGWKRQYRQICSELPSLLSFAESIGVSRNSIWIWSNRHPEFKEACTRATALSERLAAERTLNGQYNAQFGYAYMKNVFGWKDKTEVETVSSQDTQDVAGLKSALSAATPDQLAQFQTLLAAMQAQAKLPETTE